MERVVHTSHRHEDAAKWDVEQHVSMSPQERLDAARILKERAYPPDSKDVREWHRAQREGQEGS